MPQAIVLKPYGIRKPMALGWRILLVAIMLVVAALYGMISAVLPMSMLFMAAVPIFAVAVLCLWLMPDVGGYYKTTYEKLITFTLVLHILWPNYIALNFPGFPWIGPMRLVTGAMVFAFLINLATSKDMRGFAKESVFGEPLVGRLFWAYWGLTTVTLFLSSNLSSSVTKYLNNQIFWTLMFVVASMLGVRHGFIRRALTFTFIAVLPVAILSIFEYRAEKVIYIEYIPPWLWGDPELVTQLLDSSSRYSSDSYRVRGTTLNALYFAEYLAMTFPIGLYLLWKAEGLFRKLLISSSLVLLVVVMVLTDSRSVLGALAVGIGLFVLLGALILRTRNETSLVAMATLVSYPAMVAVFGVLLVTWRRLRVSILGGGQHNASDMARDVQWSRGFDILAGNPVGHGAGQSGITLNYISPSGKLTIDTYYLTVMLDYGVLALPLFIAMFSIPAWLAFTISRNHWNDEELEWMVPIGISLANFILIKSVLSSESNIPIAFVMLGFAVALAARMRAEQAGKTALSAKSALMVQGRGPSPEPV